MFDLFGWIKRKAAEAVVQGVADGVKAITPEGETPPTDIDALRALLAQSAQPKQLAAKADEEEEAESPPKKGKK